MNRNAGIFERLAPVLLAFAATTLACSGELPEVEYRARVLVCNFDAPDLPPEKGALAAETVAAAIEAGGLAHPVRPVCKLVQQWDSPLVDTRTAQDVSQNRSGRSNAGGVSTYASPSPIPAVKEASTPDADFRVEGAVSRAGMGWSVRATLFDPATSERLESAAASGEGAAGLVAASKAVAADLEHGYRSRVLEERTEAVRRSVEIGDLSRATALKRLDEMLQRWPDALPPAAVGLLLASKAKSADAQAVIQWGEWTIARLPETGLAGKRFVLRLGINNPYELLAAAYQSAGKSAEAAAVRSKAEAEGYARPASGEDGAK